MTDEPTKQPMRTKMKDTEREHILSALAVNYGCVAAAARWLDMPVSSLRYAMKKYQIDPNEFRR